MDEQNLNSTASKKVSFLLLIFCIFIAVVTLSFYLYLYVQQHKPVASVAEIPDLSTLPTKVDDAAFPQNMPTDLPIETGAQVLQNYTVPSDAGLVSTRQYVTTLPLATDFQAFKKYFTDKKWTNVQSVNTNSVKVISAQKGTIQITVNFSQNTITQANIVDITLLNKTN